LTKWL